MANEDFQQVTIRTDFYRDSIRKFIAVFVSLIVAIMVLVALFFYLYLNKPKPITFVVDQEWRVQAPVKLDDPYLTPGDLLQWVGETILKVFVFDYYHYDDQVRSYQPYFTPEGWKTFLNQLNIYANYNSVRTNKQFIQVQPNLAPTLLQRGMLLGKYAWVVRLPITLFYIGTKQTLQRTLDLRITVVRVPTLTNLTGVAIDNIIVSRNAQ